MRTTNKEVKTLIQEHILDSYTLEELRTQVDSLIGYDKVYNEYQAGIKMVQGGCFLVYYNTVEDYLLTLLDSVKVKEGDDTKNWEMYQHLIAREIDNLLK